MRGEFHQNGFKHSTGLNMRDDRESAKRMRNIFLNVINHRKTNFVVTSLIGFLALYIFFLAIFDQNFFHSIKNETTYNATLDSGGFNSTKEGTTSDSNKNSSVISHQSLIVGETPRQSLFASFFSFFILWVLALSFGYFLKCIFLPPLLGHLLIGAAFANLYFLKDVLVINKEWDDILRRTAFILILVRCAFGLNYDALKKSFVICGSLGFLSTNFEVFLIVLSSHFLFYVPLAVAIPFGFVLGSTSPAVTIPTMIRFQCEERGTAKGIPTVVLASTAIDNIYSITAFSAVASVVFLGSTDDLSYTVVRIPIEITVAAIIGLLAGVVLRIFPRNDANSVHFIRAFLACFVSLALYFGTRAIKAEIAGPVAVILLCIVIAMRWKVDNHRKTTIEENAFRLLWNLFLQPFLFVLIGLLLDFSNLTLELFGTVISILAIGVIGRIFIIFIISLGTNLDCKERLFLSFTFMPKATVQAALAPILYHYCLHQFPDGPEANLVLQSSILSIILTAPLGQLIIFCLGKAFLKQHILIAHPLATIEPSIMEMESPPKLAETKRFASIQNGPTSNAIMPVQQHRQHKLEIEVRNDGNRILRRHSGQDKDRSTVAVVYTPSFYSRFDNSGRLPFRMEHESYDAYRARVMGTFEGPKIQDVSEVARPIENLNTNSNGLAVDAKL